LYDLLGISGSGERSAEYLECLLDLRDYL